MACDYDGTIAPIVDDPMAAHPRPDTVVALRALAALANTHVAVISGRSLRDLAGLSRLPTEIHLVGSHGGEFDLGFGKRLSPRELDLRAKIKADLTEIAGRTPGAELEVKPAAVTFHYRRADRAAVRQAIEDIEAGPAALDGVHTHHNDEAVELLVVDTDKGRALESLRHRVGASAVLFFGDSPTDEHAFATLRGPDVGVRVGEGETAARHHVDDTAGVAEALAHLAGLRTEWVTGSGAVPIADHSLLSDQRTAAIVTPDARITWYCAPRIDSSAVFAELVGGPAAGYFAVCPADGSRAHRPALRRGHHGPGDPVGRDHRHRLPRRLGGPPRPPRRAAATCSGCSRAGAGCWSSSPRGWTSAATAPAWPSARAGSRSSTPPT